MKQAEFARLLGVTHQNVSKHVQGGSILLDGHGRVQVEASFQTLHGRMNAEKLARAVAAYRELQPPTLALPPVIMSAKAERDAIERDLKALQLGREAGELVLASEIEAAGLEAVAALREAFNNRKRDMAGAICVSLCVSGDRQPALTRLLNQQFEGVIGAFARKLGVQIEDDSCPSGQDGLIENPSLPRANV